MNRQQMAPQAKNLKNKRTHPRIGIINILALLWRSIAWMWSIVILGIILAVLGNAAFIFLTTGQLAFTGTVTALAWLNAHLVFFVSIITSILIITICSYLAYRQQQHAIQEKNQEQDESLIVVAKGVQRALDEHTAKPVDPTISLPLLDQKAISPKTVWNIPYRRNPFFTGREDLLKQLHEHFIQTKTAALTQPPAFTGLGGIGKTQIAIEYAHRYRDEYKDVLWVNATSRETLIDGFVDIARLLALPTKDVHDQQIMVTNVQ
ncbi:MAG TPA: hypothetical protein VFK47_16430, partial [Ktedonobacteraceae bacterium]|nr:hypothetical protein [Ktedonobacteraceae bacterium]